uniref:Uncharacterized protein n=1 Tax=viral metagenome TaxID=1070528 RepID=A0A6H1ZY78_9ZZZZ
MNEEQNEKKYFERFLNKYIFVSKQVGNDEYRYKGICLEVLDDKLILDDINCGPIPLTYEGLSVTGVKDNE